MHSDSAGEVREALVSGSSQTWPSVCLHLVGSDLSFIMKL